MPQRFMPGAAATAANILRASGAGEQRWNPVAQLNPRGGGLRNGTIFAGDVQDFGPEPFAGIDAANIAGVVFFTRLVSQAGDGFRFFHRRVVFPQHEHGVCVVGKLLFEGQHVAVGINRGRG